MTDQVLLQRRSALRIGNEVRLTNAQTLRYLKGGTPDEGIERAADLLEDPVHPSSEIRIGLLLRAIPNMGWAKSLFLLKRADVRLSDRRLSELTERQRLVLARDLRLRAWRA